MSKKLIYFVSALSMLFLAIAVGILFSQSVPMPLTEEAHRTQETKSIHVEPLAPIENIIARSVEGEPIATTSLADKYAQVQKKLSLPPDLSAMDFSGDLPNINISEETEENTQLSEENLTQNHELHLNQASSTEKNQEQLDDILASASADSSSHNVDIAPSSLSNENLDATQSSPPTNKNNMTPSNLVTSENTDSTINREITQNMEAINSKESVHNIASAQIHNELDNTKESINTVSTTASITSSPQANTAPNIPKLKTNALITSTALDTLTNTNVITKATLSMDGDQVQLLLLGNNTLKGVSFILDNPDRIVFDIAGIWKMTVPRLISNRMVRDFTSWTNK